MYCNNCGQEVNEQAKYCPRCGAPLRESADAQQQGEPKMSYESGREPQKQKKKSHKLLIILLILCALILAAIIGVLLYTGTDSYKVNRQLSLGDRYLEEKDYERAVAAYEKAVEIDPKSVDGQVGLATAYTEYAQDQAEKAQEARSTADADLYVDYMTTAREEVTYATETFVKIEELVQEQESGLEEEKIQEILDVLEDLRRENAQTQEELGDMPDTIDQDSAEEGSTEETVEAAEEEDKGPVYQAYLELLEEREDDILQYEERIDTYNDAMGQYGYGKNIRGIALYDLNGDGIEELLFTAAETIPMGDGAVPSYVLYIYTYLDGEVTEVYRDTVMAEVGGGSDFLVAMQRDSDSVMIIDTSYDDFESALISYCSLPTAAEDASEGEAASEEETSGSSVPYGTAEGEGTWNGHVYKVFTQNMTWAEAKGYCESQGGHLVSITSQEEQDYIAANILPYGGVDDIWIGMSSDWTAWVTGEAVTYTNWGDNEPDGWSTGQTCGVICPDVRSGSNSAGDYYIAPGQWDDIADGGHYFICEWDNPSAYGSAMEENSWRFVEAERNYSSSGEEYFLYYVGGEEGSVGEYVDYTRVNEVSLEEAEQNRQEIDAQIGKVILRSDYYNASETLSNGYVQFSGEPEDAMNYEEAAERLRSLTAAAEGHSDPDSTTYALGDLEETSYGLCRDLLAGAESFPEERYKFIDRNLTIVAMS